MTVIGFFNKAILHKWFPFEIDQVNILKEKFDFKLNYKEERHYLEVSYKIKNNTKYPINLMGISYTLNTWDNDLVLIGDKQVFTYIDVDASYDVNLLILLTDEQARLLKKYYKQMKKLLLNFEIKNHLQTYFGLSRKVFSFSPENLNYGKIIL